MILGIGVDICEVKRLARARRRPAFERRVFDPQERRDCQGRARPNVHFAARFAAKEACLKALGTGWSGGVGWTEVAVRSNHLGQPEMQMSGTAGRLARRLGVTRSHLSLSHGADYAVAVVVLEGGRPGGSAAAKRGGRAVRRPGGKPRATAARRAPRPKGRGR